MRHPIIPQFTGKTLVFLTNIKSAGVEFVFPFIDGNFFLFFFCFLKGMVLGKGYHAGSMDLHTLLNVLFKQGRVLPTTLHWRSIKAPFSGMLMSHG